MRRTPIFAFMTLLISAGLAGAQSAEVSFAKDVQPILTKSCEGCHGAKKKKAGLDLSAAAAYKAIVSAQSKQVIDMMLVQPGDPEKSYLYLKIEHRAKEGAGMPRVFFWSKKLPDIERQTIKDWIAGGAKE